MKRKEKERHDLPNPLWATRFEFDNATGSMKCKAKRIKAGASTLRPVKALEHLKKRWYPLCVEGIWRVVTDEVEPWYVAGIPIGLPGDGSGHKTATAICEQHNCSLEKGER